MIFDIGGRKMQPITGPKPREGHAFRVRSQGQGQNLAQAVQTRAAERGAGDSRTDPGMTSVAAARREGGRVRNSV